MVIVNLSFDTLKIKNKKNKNILASNHDKIMTNHAKEREHTSIKIYECHINHFCPVLKGL